VAESNFLDYISIYCRSGKGGSGSAHLRREKYVPKGGPDGGDGGRGGHIILRGNKQLWTLLHLKYQRHIMAESGGSGSGANKHGAKGKDKVIELPLGTVIRDSESREVLMEITGDGEERVLLSGGRGGLGNTHFKSSTNQTPRYAQPGEPEQEGRFIFELKMLADIGLVGFPNAGKSTLLSVLSAAKPKVADYPFTTLEPKPGIVSVGDYKSFVMADIPGIIEGAHEGKGLGHRFLRHIERNAALLFCIPADSMDIGAEYRTLHRELELYNPELLDKDRLVAITKADLLDDELTEAIENELTGTLPPYLFVSSFSKLGLNELKSLIWKTLNHD
jgi:GTP-binding protein